MVLRERYDEMFDLGTWYTIVNRYRPSTEAPIYTVEELYSRDSTSNSTRMLGYYGQSNDQPADSNLPPPG